MGEQKPRMAASLKAIRRILMDEWDPCMVRGAPEAQDEYDRYIMGLYRMLREGTSEKAIRDFLTKVERDGMGATPQVDRIAIAAQKLMEVDVSADEVFH